MCGFPYLKDTSQTKVHAPVPAKSKVAVERKPANEFSYDVDDVKNTVT